MIDFARECWDFGVYMMGTSPAGLWPLVIALIGSALITQKVKFWTPIEWPAWRRALYAQFTAFSSALLIVIFLWPTRFGLAAGFCIGLASPTIYAIAVRLIGLKWPQIRDLLSQDVRPEA